MSADLFPVSVDVMVDEVRRELEMRRNVYPRQVAAHRMNARQADRRIEIMAALLAKLEKERDDAR
jgi:hypothetical protein